MHSRRIHGAANKKIIKSPHEQILSNLGNIPTEYSDTMYVPPPNSTPYIGQLAAWLRAALRSLEA
jgi:hypothetical protein